MNEYLFGPIQARSFEQVSDLLVECFVDDSYFVGLFGDSDRRTAMHDMFRHSIRVCAESGLAFGWYESHSLRFVAVSLWFDYNKLRRDRPQDFHLIFDWPAANYSTRSQLAKKIFEHIGGDSEYLYLLSLAVDPSHRKKGLATGLIGRVQRCYSQYNIFSDVSNDFLAKALIRHLGFRKLDRSEGCSLLRFLTPMYDSLAKLCSDKEIATVLPEGYGAKFFPDVPRERVTLRNVRVMQDTPYFVQDIMAGESFGEMLLLENSQLYRWQQTINPLLCEEMVTTVGSRNAVIYIHQNGTPVEFLRYGEQLTQDIVLHEEEWQHILDIFTLIPMSYEDTVLLSGNKPEAVNVRRILRAVDFRAKYESAIYVEGKDKESFATRVKRRFLEMCTLQLYCESELSLDGLRASDRKIGEPVIAALMVSYDSYTACAVLQIALLSCGLLSTQYLDSISRNQISLLTEDGKENLYEYLERRYKLRKRGSPKNYINFHACRDSIDDALLASMLYCETFYNSGESLGSVIDPNVINQLHNEYGMAQYNYASAFFHTNSVVHIVEKYPSIRDRIVGESVTLFYIEMVLYEESAIEIMNFNTVNLLTQVNDYSHGALIYQINRLMNKHVMSIAFWNMKMNYPSSTCSLDLIRKSFGIDEKRNEVERNKKQLVTLSQMRENYLSYVESRIISVLGIMLTLLSLADFIANPGKTRMLIFAVLAFVLIWLYIQSRFYRLHK